MPYPIVEHVTGIPLANSVRLAAQAELTANPLEKTRVADVPAALTDPLTRPGGPCVELFVTVCAAKDKESFPKLSCTAAFEVAESDAGAVYATVTSAPAFMAVARVN